MLKNKHKHTKRKKRSLENYCAFSWLCFFSVLYANHNGLMSGGKEAKQVHRQGAWNNAPKIIYIFIFTSTDFTYTSSCMCVFLPVPVTLMRLVCLQRPGRWRGGRTWLTLHVCQLLLSRVLGKQTTQSAYMLSALWATGSPHVYGAFCLMCCFDVCIKIISSLGVCVLWEHWRPCKRNTWGAERAEWP